MRIAVIPARGGSKRIPRKNIREFCGKPMIAWSIETAIKSGCFDEVTVSTDDEEIAQIGRDLGAVTPFVRPKELSGDFVGTTEVIRHAADWYVSQGFSLDQICCIYATAPFVTVEDVIQGQLALSKGDVDYVFSVSSFDFPVQRAIRIGLNGFAEMLFPEHTTSRSQDLEEAFHDAGQFYWGTVSAWLQAKPIFASRSLPLVLPRYRVQDIDTTEDWERAEWMFRAMQR